MYITTTRFPISVHKCPVSTTNDPRWHINSVPLRHAAVTYSREHLTPLVISFGVLVTRLYLLTYTLKSSPVNRITSRMSAPTPNPYNRHVRVCHKWTTRHCSAAVQNTHYREPCEYRELVLKVNTRAHDRSIKRNVSTKLLKHVLLKEIFPSQCVGRQSIYTDLNDRLSVNTDPEDRRYVSTDVKTHGPSILTSKRDGL